MRGELLEPQNGGHALTREPLPRDRTVRASNQEIECDGAAAKMESAGVIGAVLDHDGHRDIATGLDFSRNVEGYPQRIDRRVGHGAIHGSAGAREPGARIAPGDSERQRETDPDPARQSYGVATSEPSSAWMFLSGLYTNGVPAVFPPQRIPTSLTLVPLVIWKTGDPLSPEPSRAETNV